MPFPVFDLAPVWNCVQQSQVEDIEIRAYDIERHLPNGYVIYRGGVEAIIGVTRIVTDTLIVRDAPEGAELVDVQDGGQTYRLGNHEARAIGAIKIIDPDGTIQASDLWVTWVKDLAKDSPTARARGFKVEIGKFLMNADEATKIGTSWDLSNVRATTDKSSRPLYTLSMDHLLIEPGRQGTGKGVSISLLGTKLPKIPSMAFSLDRRARATRIPQLSYRQRDGFGVAWDGNFVSGDQSLLTTSISSFPKLPPTFVTTYSSSRIPYEKSIQNQFQTQSDLGERNPFSFFGNIYMADIEAQNSFQSAPRDTFQVSTTFNVGTFGRRSDLQGLYSKPIEVLQEKTGQKNGYAFATQLRAGLFQEGGDKAVGRGLIAGAISPAYRQSGRMITSLRLDGGLRM
ncbi:MAG: hypothetical protein QE269_11760, partial [Fimbriimonas sp.]|nr:hypothetical protein [Fimbriimonas sp.]